VNQHIKTCFTNVLDKVSWLLALERNTYTLNTHYLADYKDKFLAYYKAARDNDANSSLMRAIEMYKPGAVVSPPSSAPSAPSAPASGTSSAFGTTFSFDTPAKSQNAFSRTSIFGQPASSSSAKDTATPAPVASSTLPFSSLAAGIEAAATQVMQSSQQQTGIAKILAGFAEIGVHGIKPEDVAKVLPPDQMESALDIMADVRAYFQGLYRFLSPPPLPHCTDRQTSRVQEIHG
jgi:hypothetical protein